MPTVATITPASATEGTDVVFNFTLSNFWSKLLPILLYWQWYGWSADYTTTNVDVTVPAGATTGTVSVPTTADTIDEVTENFSIALELRLRVPLSTITMRLLWQRSLFGYWRIWWFNFTLSNPSDQDITYTFVLTNGTAGSADYTTTNVDVTCSCGATTGTGTYNCGYDWWSNENLALPLELLRLRVPLSTITMPYCGNDRSCFGYWRNWCGIQLYIKQPFWVRPYYALYWLMVRLEVQITLQQTLMYLFLRVQLELFRYHNCGCDWWSNWKLYCLGCFGYGYNYRQ
jgi:hypothetical protein